MEIIKITNDVFDFNVEWILAEDKEELNTYLSEK
jgi:hypothetical protein